MDCTAEEEDNIVQEPVSSPGAISNFVRIFESKINELKDDRPDINLQRKCSLQIQKSSKEDKNESVSVDYRRNTITSTPGSFFSVDQCDQNYNKSLQKNKPFDNLSNETGQVDRNQTDKMDLHELEDIDVTQISGYTKIPDNIPDWKKYQLERKNKEAIDLYLIEKRKEEEEKNKYGDIPQWKKELIIKKEKELKEKIDSQNSELDMYGDIPQWKKDLLKKKQISNK